MISYNGVYPEVRRIRINMKVSSLLERLEYTCCQGSVEQEVSTVEYDSRKVIENSLFICIKGAVVDGHKFVPDVVAKGAKTLVVQDDVEARQNSSRPSESQEPKERPQPPTWSNPSLKTPDTKSA